MADFGLSVFAQGQSQNYASQRGGNYRWMAPELIDPEKFCLYSSRPTYASDAFAFGCVIVEVRFIAFHSFHMSSHRPKIYTCRAPYPEFTDAQVLQRVVEGKRPTRPLPMNGISICDAVWFVVTSCFLEASSQRPTVQGVAITLKEILNKPELSRVIVREGEFTPAC